MGGYGWILYRNCLFSLDEYRVTFNPIARCVSDSGYVGADFYCKCSYGMDQSIIVADEVSDLPPFGML